MSERIVKMVSAPVESVHGVYKPSPVVDAKSGLHAALHMVMKHTADMFVTIVDVLSEKYSLDKEEMFGVILEHPKYKDMYVNPVLLDLGYINSETKAEPEAKAEEPEPKPTEAESKPEPEAKAEEPAEKPRRKMSDEAKAAAAAKRAATIAAKKSATTKPEPQPEPQPEPTEAKPEPTEAKPTETNPEITATAAPKKRVFKIKAKAPTT